MKKMIIFLLILAMCLPASAMADTDRINDRLFDSAKQLLHSLDTGDYTTATTLSGCADSGAMKQFAEQNFTALGSGEAQVRISVAYYDGTCWKLAVPVTAPDTADVETLLLDCGTGDSISGYTECRWDDVSAALDTAQAVIWNEEYAGNVAVIGD